MSAMIAWSPTSSTNASGRSRRRAGIRNGAPDLDHEDQSRRDLQQPERRLICVPGERRWNRLRFEM